MTLKDVFFTDINKGIVVGYDGTIIRTTNGGTNWISLNSGVTEDLRSVSFGDANTGIIVGEECILRSSNGGSSWIIIGSGTGISYSSVSLANINYGTLVGWDLYNYAGVRQRTTDGGFSWIGTGSPSNIYHEVTMIDSISGTIVGVAATSGGGGKIWRTINGTDWISQISGTGNSLRGVSFIDANSGWAVGLNGTILRTTNGGATFIEEEQIDKTPINFYLSQNFPNPFNPSTTIYYGIPEGSFVRLSVYNLLGEKVTELVNEYKDAGNYSINFNLENYNSGIYLYKLQADDFIQTKKMILLK